MIKVAWRHDAIQQKCERIFWDKRESTDFVLSLMGRDDISKITVTIQDPR